MELASKSDRSSNSYSKSRWLGAHENESADWYSTKKQDDQDQSMESPLKAEDLADPSGVPSFDPILESADKRDEEEDEEKRPLSP